ncbi:hypothetical protein FRC03_003589 [Tulasnella sp. 419]|nr:hypothetical protein FRC03_003589 [Tulasnella sp. 419]
MAQDESVDIRITALTVFLQTPVLYPSVSRPQGVNQRALARPTSFLQPAGQIHIDFHLPPDNNLLESYATALADHSSLLQAIQGAASPTSEEFIRKSISFIDMLQSSLPKPDLPSSLFEKGKYPAVLAMIASCDDEKLVAVPTRTIAIYLFIRLWNSVSGAGQQGKSDVECKDSDTFGGEAHLGEITKGVDWLTTRGLSIELDCASLWIERLENIPEGSEALTLVEALKRAVVCGDIDHVDAEEKRQELYNKLTELQTQVSK